MILKVFKKFQYYWNRRNGQAFIKYLKKQGINIGERCEVKRPLTLDIDISRPELLSIGNHVFLHKGLTIMTHDWASWVFLETSSDFIPSHGKVVIGNNVWFGENCTVLKGVSIGDNCIIGYGSTVIKSIPSNSVAVGTPAKVICTIEEYYQKRKRCYVNEVFEYAFEIEKRKGREPVPEDFPDDYPAFVDTRNSEKYTFPYGNVFKVSSINSIYPLVSDSRTL